MLVNVQKYRTILLGGGMVAGYAAKEFVEAGLKPGELAIVSADSALPYERPPLSKSVLAGKDNEQTVLISAENFYREHGIDVHLNTKIERIDVAGRKVIGDRAQFEFEKLILATGAQPRTLTVPGADGDRVLYLRSLRDSIHLRDRLKSAKNVLIVGSGFIGMEVASQSAQQGRSTTMVFPGERVWQSFFTPEMSQFFRTYYENRGVRVLPAGKIESIRGGSSVQLSTGKTLDADLIVAGVGVTPVTEIAETAGLQVENGIVVNEFLETSAANVYAAGDVATYQDVIFAKQRRIEHWDNAVKQGQYVARRLSGSTDRFENVPYFFSDIFDLSYEFWGDTTGAERTEYKGDVRSTSFSAWWFKGSRVVAAFVMSRPDAEREQASRLQWEEH